MFVWGKTRTVGSINIGLNECFGVIKKIYKCIHICQHEIDKSDILGQIMYIICGKFSVLRDWKTL